MSADADRAESGDTESDEGAGSRQDGPGPRDEDVHAASSEAEPDQEEGEADDADRPTEAAVDLPRTGDEAVDRALQVLPGIAGADPADQLETYVGVHRALQDRLADSGA